MQQKHWHFKSAGNEKIKKKTKTKKQNQKKINEQKTAEGAVYMETTVFRPVTYLPPV